VSFGNRPAIIEDGLIEALRQLPVREPERLFQPGQAVKFVDGPLRGLEGIYEQADGEMRAMVLVDLLSKHHRVTTDMQHLMPLTH
jgi:transcriptional antiterminator RfaH